METDKSYKDKINKWLSEALKEPNVSDEMKEAIKNWFAHQEEQKPLATFNAYEPEDIEVYSHAWDCYFAFMEILSNLRADRKWNESLSSSEIEQIEKFEALIYKELEERGINLDKIP